MEQTQTILNPYLDKFHKLVHKTSDDSWWGWEYKEGWRSDHRHELVKTYSWAVPNEEAISKLVELSPIVEIGAGLGYWAYLVNQAGGEILPFDKALDPKKNDYTQEDASFWTKVYLGDHTALAASTHWPRYTLFLCWPPYSDSMALDCLHSYTGDTLVYVGEGSGGCNATERFFDELTAYWTLDEQLEIPQWPGLHDYFSVYRRQPLNR